MATYTIDPAHSEIGFRVRHLMISTVSGTFSDFSGTMEAEKEDFSDARIAFSAQTASLSTHNAQRDEHLRSEEFFDTASFPELTFESTALRPGGGDAFVLEGNLTLRGVTKPVQLQATYNGTMTDPYGQTKHGFEVSGKINRKDYGLNWSAVTEAGGVVVSDEVRLDINVQFIQQK